MKREVIRVGIVGAGYVSAYHLRALQSLDYVTVVGIADTDQTKARHVAEEFRIPTVCASLDELMALKPHVVHILTPPSLHRDLSIRAMRMGADVFVEKPMAENAEDCDLMIAAASETGRVLSVNHSARMDPVVLRALELVRSGSIGDVLAVHFFRNSDYAPYTGGELPAPYRRGGYPFEDLGVHGLYLMEAFLGSITDVDVRYRSTGRDPNLFFDEWHAFVEAEKGTGHMYISWNSRPMQNELIVHGTSGIISVDCYLQRLSVQTTLPAPKPIQRMLGTAMAAAGTLYGVSVNAVKFVTGRLKPNAGIHTSVRKFYEALAAGAAPPVSAEEGRRAVRWMESAVREADRRKVEALAPASVSQPARVLVTGASGLLGSALLRRLRSQGVVARVLLRRPSPALAAEPDVEVVYGDLGDPSAVDRAVRNIDVVYHVGSAMSGGKAAFEAGTVAATRNVVTACVRHGVRRLVHVSSIILLDHAGHTRGAPVDESHPVEPKPELRGFYTQAKLEAERIVLDAVRREGLPAVIVRPGQLVGRGVEKFAPAGTIAFGGRWVVVGDGTMRLAAVHIEDAVDALLLAAERQVCGQIFHVVDTVNVLTQNDYIEACRDVVGPKLRVSRVPAPVLTGAALMASLASRVTGLKLPLSLYRLRSSAPIGPFDCRAAREKLGWTPNVGTAVGLTAVVAAEPAAGVGAGGAYAFARGNDSAS
jgi:predicted dehydrogenase/nucleoside-diphosphate-sugar epimerase